MNYYPHHIGDYAKDTRALSQGEHGAYRLLMDEAYSTENGIDADEVYAIACCKSAQERKNADRVLAKFFVLQDGRYRQKRVDQEIAAFRDKSAKASQSARQKWAKRNANAERTQCERIENAERTQEERICEIDAPNNQKPKAKEKEEKTSPPNGGSSLWDFGVSMLAEQGVKEGTARGFIGSLCREWDEHHVEDAIRAAVGKANAQGYIRGVLKDKPRKGQQVSIV